jgi:hypothetical protein
MQDRILFLLVKNDLISCEIFYPALSLITITDYYELGLGRTAFLGQFLRQKLQISGIEEKNHQK